MIASLVILFSLTIVAGIRTVIEWRRLREKNAHTEFVNFDGRLVRL